MKHKPYPTYKPSGVAWLGEMPEHWEVKRLKDLLLPKKGAIKTGPFGSQLLSSEMYDGDVKVYNQKSVITNDFAYGENYISFEKFEELKEFRTFPGDFLITTRGTIGRCAILPKNAEQGILHPCLMRLQTNKFLIIDRFLEILIEESEVILEQLKIKSNGTTIEVIYQDSLKNVIVLLPPLPEQQAIASFLDCETGRIDRLIEKKKKLVALLKEERTALISRAVTKGLDASAKLKPSGVAWLGDVPEHWEVKRITYVLDRLQDGTHFSPKSDFTSEYLYITAKNIKEWGFDLSEITYVSKEAHEEIYKRCPVKKGDVLYIKDGATAGIATVNSLDKEFSMLSSIAMLRPNYFKLDARYLAYHLNMRAFKLFVLNSLVGGAMTRFTIEIISRFRLITPPLPEQKAIADFLDRETASIDTLVSKVETVIEKLKEYRTALISAAVTGKIDVREET